MRAWVLETDVHIYVYVSGSGKRDLMAQKIFLELLILSSSTIFEL